MKGYLMRIVGAVLICVFSDMALPDKWSKYVKIITGLIIISAIASPFENPLDINFKDYFKESEKLETDGEEYQRELIKEELENNISTDIKTRMSDEFNVNIDADVKIEINDEDKISGIDKISLQGDITQKMVDRINEIYAPGEIFSDGH